MLKSRDKISLRQALLIFFIIAFSPAIRLIPAFAAEKAKQAAWLTPLPALVPMFIMVFILNSVFRVYKNKSLMDATCDILGVWIGKLLIFIYYLWHLLLTSLYLRYDIERLVSSTYHNIEPNLLTLITLAIIAYILPKGITVIGRMAEIILPVILTIYIIICILLLPGVRSDSLTPISVKDALPVFQGSLVALAIGSYFFTIFFMGNSINDKEKVIKAGVKYSIFYITLLVSLIFVVVGTLTWSVTSRLPVAFLVTVKQISVLDTIEKIESLVVGTWIYADFILLSVFIFVTLNMLKSIFNLKETKHLLNVYLILLFFLSLGVSKNAFELRQFSNSFLIYINIILTFSYLIIIYVVGKLRKKI